MKTLNPPPRILAADVFRSISFEGFPAFDSSISVYILLRTLLGILHEIDPTIDNDLRVEILL